MGGYSRRRFLRFGGTALIPLGGAAAAAPVSPAPAGSVHAASFDRLRRRWREVSAGSGFDAAAEPYRARLARLGARAAGHAAAMTMADASLWPDLPFPSFVATPARLRAMARACVLPGTGVAGDPALAEAVAAGVDHYRRRVYAAGAEPYGNWWHWRIGVPKALLDASLLIGLSGPRGAALVAAVDHFVPGDVLSGYSGTSTGANRVDLCLVVLLRAMLASDPGRAARAVSALAPVFAYVTEGDGFYRDGSFIQHSTVPYQGAYGASLLSGVATLLAVLQGSPWEPAAPRVVLDGVERSFAPFVHDGFCMDLVRGRGLARAPYGDHRRGREIAAAILLLGETASPAERDRWRAMVKGWARRDTAAPMLDAALRDGDLAFHARLARILADDAVPAAREPAGHRLMPMSARAVHRRPGWCAALSMASSTVGHYEHGNGENLRGWHTGSGMLYWWVPGHGAQYSDSFWTTVDPYRLPGTTVSTRRLPDGAGGAWGDTPPPARWVGGATDGTYATAGQHLYGLESTLEAFKSWFFLDDAVLCLGAGITARDGVPVETIMDNRRTDALLTVDDREGWAWLEGHGGYVLLTCPALRTLREERTAPGASAWGTASSPRVSRSYATLWFDHGVDPVSAGYAYLLMPGADRAATRVRAADPGWARVLANTGHHQGVHIPSLGITAVNFWRAGTVGPLTASGPCAVLARDHGDGTAALTVADPRRDLPTLTVTWDRPAAAVLRTTPALTSATLGPPLTLTFTGLNTHHGASHTTTLRLAPTKSPATALP
ncbi:lyase [Sphaerisporangium siamense]|uniref:Hyaluronate lyase n=1 Tax=Sphaerisporangium siamense TaxID=795645 RepID=A0A7W7D7C2_9ACTN|nr:polysaccharide lyase 8 family protein [Sphaerisporangium siamense]MBB4700311.1 hyaluronate lyase [Sphaerisporangium siamense]GII87726.1 lyase [Sphaerisporangium siamense]